jgi:diaminopimelate decarboxylase
VSGVSLQDRELVCDGVSLTALAEAEGTPLYVYSAAVIRERYQRLDRAFGNYPHSIHYGLKANSNLSLARLMQSLGSGADANTVWEIEVALRAGFSPRDIVFTGVGKSRDELQRAVPLGLKAIIVESAGELARIERIADEHGVRVRVAIRVNPDIDSESHPHISTGRHINKFGIPADSARELMLTLDRRLALQLVAVHVHIGSQITSAKPLANAAAFAARLVRDLQQSGVELEAVDLGGGLGISYDGRPTLSLDEYVSTLVSAIRSTGLPIMIEPGRSIVGPSATLLARVVDLKPAPEGREFAVIDAGMTELIRPALYGAFHRIEPVQHRDGVERHYEIVGPVCESSDVVGHDRRLPPVEVGDLLAIHDVGAYGSAMASNYNRRPLPMEVLVDHGRHRVIRRRQGIDDLLAMEA